MIKYAVNINKYKYRKDSLGSDYYHEEYQYINLLKDIIEHGSIENGRNGTVHTVIGSAMHFSLENGKIPILTTKKTAWKTCLKELLWFIKGNTSNIQLNDVGVHIWDANTTREFLDSRNLQHYTEGTVGPLYGFQWRNWNAEYKGCDFDYAYKGIDQLQNVINILKDPEQRSSRRMIISAWNVEQIDAGCLPPCHVLMQFNIIEGNKLSCCLYQRSKDEALGCPFNIASYSFLVHLLAKHCDLIPYEFIHYGGNCHIYSEHIEQMKEQITRHPYPFPTLEILNKRDNINDYVIDDFNISNYNFHPSIQMKMVA
jgi:thymidylate synthase